MKKTKILFRQFDVLKKIIFMLNAYIDVKFQSNSCCLWFKAMPISIIFIKTSIAPTDIKINFLLQ